MSFVSILFNGPDDWPDSAEPSEPDFFADLNLDQVVASITAGREEYRLTRFFHTPLRTVASIDYRHEVLRDLEGQKLVECIDTFAQAMRAMRQHLAQAAALRNAYQRECWYLDGVALYVDAVHRLARDLSQLDLHSRGLLAVRDHLLDYVASNAFTGLAAEVSQLKDQLSGVRYCLDISEGRIKVSRYEGEADYSTDVAATFAKFRQGAVKDYRVKFSNYPEMNHVEAAVLDLVARLYPEIFAALDGFCVRHRDYLDSAVAAFDRDVQFYLAYRDFTRQLERNGLTFCYPQISEESKEVLGRETFDVALASKLAAERSPVVCNDFHLTDPERIFVVSGPNQGGKTTFARTFGQLHYLASLGLPVPGSQARLLLFDRIFTHFEREENLHDLHGKLQDDLLRIHQILARATPRSVVIVNEIFTSTTLDDAIFLGTEVLQRIIELDLLCVCVTFVDELALLSETTVSMVSAVVPDDPAVRTYKLERRPANGLAYALAIAEKYRVTYQALRTRVRS
jgi:DNA mismatch repair protein MutS